MANFNPVDLFDLVIFGGAGDLALRKLMPALYHRDCAGQLPPDSRITGLGRRDLSRDRYLDMVNESLREHLEDGSFSDEVWKAFSSRLDYIPTDARDHQSWNGLANALSGHEDRVRVFYLATAPDLFGTIAEGCKENGLIKNETRIVLEKPVGRDYESARAINDRVGACFPENRIYRIDYFRTKKSIGTSP